MPILGGKPAGIKRKGKLKPAPPKLDCAAIKAKADIDREDHKAKKKLRDYYQQKALYEDNDAADDMYSDQVEKLDQELHALEQDFAQCKNMWIERSCPGLLDPLEDGEPDPLPDQTDPKKQQQARLLRAAEKLQQGANRIERNSISKELWCSGLPSVGMEKGGFSAHEHLGEICSNIVKMSTHEFVQEMRTRADEFLHLALLDPPSLDYDNVVEPDIKPMVEAEDATLGEKLSLQASDALRQSNLYLQAYTTSYERYQGAESAGAAEAMARQAEAMFTFANTAKQKSREATVKWYDFEQLAFSAIKSTQSMLVEKGIRWEDAFVEWQKQEKNKPRGIGVYHKPSIEYLLHQKLLNLTPNQLKKNMGEQEQELEMIASVKKFIQEENLQLSWPEPSDLIAFETMEYYSIYLYEKVIHTGVQIEVADWVPPRDENSSWWGATLPGQSPDHLVNSSQSNDPILLVPGQYDMYWKHDYYHLPILLASKIEVKENEVASVVVNSALRIEVADWVPPRDANSSWWGATLPGQSPDLPVNWNKSNDPILLVPGQYDVYWKHDFHHPPILLASKVEVKENEVASIIVNSALGLDVADWVPPRDANSSWWGATLPGQSPDHLVNWNKSNDPILLVPGQYDVYWKHDYHHPPILLASKVEVKENEVASVVVNSALGIEVADWVPPRDANSSWWGATLPGQSPDHLVNWNTSNDPILLMRGQYDVYWKHDYHHPPILLASKVEVKQNTVIAIPINSGIKLRVLADTPALDANQGWWGVTREGGRADQPLHWVKGQFDQPLLLPPGSYDIVWRQDNTHQPIKIKEGVVIPDNTLLEVEIESLGSTSAQS